MMVVVREGVVVVVGDRGSEGRRELERVKTAKEGRREEAAMEGVGGG